MKMDIYDLMYGLNDVSDYIVMETQKKSPQLKERAAVKWCALAACVCLVFGALLYSGIMNGRHGYGRQRSRYGRSARAAAHLSCRLG